MNHFTRRTTNILQSENKQKEKTTKTLMKKTLANRTRTMQTAKKAIAAVTLAAGLFLVLPSVSYSANPLASCAVNWDNPNALGRIYDKASTTFAVASTYDSNGRLVYWDPKPAEPIPSSAQTNPKRWMYKEYCGNGYISVWVQNYSHFHLSFEDPSMNCVNEFGFGRMIGGKCVSPADYAREPRVAESHDGFSWWEILYLNGGTLKTFDLKTISVGGDTPIQMWFRKVDGSVWGWPELGAGVNWNVSGSASGIVAVWVSAKAGNPYSFRINDFSFNAY
jgi:hypothetical protein